MVNCHVSELGHFELVKIFDWFGWWLDQPQNANDRRSWKTTCFCSNLCALKSEYVRIMALLLGSKQAMRAYSSARLGSPWMRTRKQLLAFCKGEQCLGRPVGGVQLLRLEDSSRKSGNNCLTSPRLVHLFLPCHGALSSRAVYLNPTWCWNGHCANSCPSFRELTTSHDC